MIEKGVRQLKTATITYFRVYNYGALLQAYALQQVQDSLSVDNVIIDYTEEKIKLYQIIKGSSFKLWIVNILRLLETIRDYLPIKRRRKSFEEFIAKRLRLSQKYADLEVLKRKPPKADVYLAGSDQLWNVSQGIKRAFFLDFGGKEIKRASYAVSIGAYPVPQKYTSDMYALLNKFQALSVREPEAKEFLNELLGKDVEIKLHCDPVFLLTKEEWLKLAVKRKIRKRYILCIPMSGHPALSKALNKLKKLTGYSVVILSSDVFTRVRGDYYIKDASPENYLYLIKNAEYVVTTSFHGTAFSIIFRKNFFSFTGTSAPARITSLLKYLGLEKRILKSAEGIHTEQINYAKADILLRKEKEEAIEYLKGLFKQD